MTSGYAIQAVREARRARKEIQRGELWAAIECLLWAWKWMGMLEARHEGRALQEIRAWRAIDAVRLELSHALRLQAIVSATHRRRLAHA